MNTNAKQGKGYVGKPNTAMADKLSDIKDKVKVRSEPKQNGNNDQRDARYPAQTKRPLMRKVIDLGRDGEDHINVYSNCNTTLGQFFSQSNLSSFIHPFFGSFISRENLYHFLLSVDGDERLRTMKPSLVRHFVHDNGNVLDYYPNLHYHLATALWIQIKNNWGITKIIRKNELPFDAYFTLKHEHNGKYNFIPVRPYSDVGWIIEIVNIVSSAIKNNVQPNFDHLIDDEAALVRLINRVSFVERKVYVKRPPNKKKPKFKPELKPEIVHNMGAVDTPEDLLELAKEQEALRQSPLENMAGVDIEESNVVSTPTTSIDDDKVNETSTPVQPDPINVAEQQSEPIDTEVKVNEESNVDSSTEQVPSANEDRT